MKFESDYGTLNYHDTPWNNKALQGNSLEIDSIVSSNENSKELLSEFCFQKSNESYILIAARVPATSFDLKKVYFQCGFITVEHTLDVVSHGLDLDKVTTIANKYPVKIEDYTKDDIGEIEDIAAEEFHFGRFFEDPFIPHESAKNRNRYWIRDLINQQASIKIIRKKDKVVGFMAYKINSDRADLVLSGLKEKYRHLAYGFIANILLSLKDVKELHTLISSSNIDVLDLYNYFGFRFGNPQFGFHKHL